MSETTHWNDRCTAPRVNLGTYGECVTLRLDEECGHVQSDRLPEFIAALYEAAGKPPPIVLERTNEAVDYTWMLHGLGFGIRSGGVEITHPNGGQLFEPSTIRGLAARLAEMADAAEAKGELDPAEVQSLADEMYADVRRIGGPPPEEWRIAARAALRWMKQREQS